MSALSLQWVNDLPGTLAQIRRALKPDGFFLAALIGGETLGELRESLAVPNPKWREARSPRVSPFVDVRTLGSLLQRAGFALPVTDVERMTVRYERCARCCTICGAWVPRTRSSSAAGSRSSARSSPARRKFTPSASPIADGRLRATFDVLWLSAWAPHESQQKPLQPGSAKMRLADALGTREQPAGEKPGAGRGKSRASLAFLHLRRGVATARQCAGGLARPSFTRRDRSQNRQCAGSAACPPAASDNPSAATVAPRRFPALRLPTTSLPAPADIERHQKMEFFVGVTREGKRRETILPHDDAEFFPRARGSACPRAARRLRSCRRETPTGLASACRRGRRVSSTRPSASISAQAATSTSFSAAQRDAGQLR